MTVSQSLHVVPSQFTVAHLPHATFPEDDEWIALVRAPEGLTVVRDASPYTEAQRWIGFYGETAHSLDTPGMLAAVVGPLADAGISVFVASTYHADLVLVPEHSYRDAADALRAAGHRVGDAGVRDGRGASGAR
ncbi:ACT domain-containing protein [Actinomadura sp. LOL_016]|uniref:ACT domain-containing protein n=1 Tax=unclassified Actinomadura TaxID=2626254 RepID=UPI003A811AE4